MKQSEKASIKNFFLIQCISGILMIIVILIFISALFTLGYLAKMQTLRETLGLISGISAFTLLGVALIVYRNYLIMKRIFRKNLSYEETLKELNY